MGMAQPKIPRDLRARLETARQESLALFRALDQLDLSATEIPQIQLRELLELDADFAEALWALDQPKEALNFGAMVKDTEASLKRFSLLCGRFRSALPARTHVPLGQHERAVRGTLTAADSYRQVPGRDPQAG